MTIPEHNQVRPRTVSANQSMSFFASFRNAWAASRWLVPHALAAGQRLGVTRSRPMHLLLCIADHFEPGAGGASAEQADARVESWIQDYPRLFDRFHDSDGQPPRHTFFYPLEMYREQELNALSELCRMGYGEIEVHLHHANDTADNLRRTLQEYTQLLATRHGLLSRGRESREIRYGFVHGNWALANCRPDGCWCGVDDELDVLRETGCYADFTFPAYPNAAQSRKVNSIYYASTNARRTRSFDRGVDAGSGQAPPKSLLLIQGPLMLNWGSRKFGLIPRPENATLQANQPPTEDRLNLWLKAAIRVATRPDWFFVKLHTHGAIDKNRRMLLGDPMLRFHEALQRRADADPSFHFHYVTAREMYNLVKAAESGWTGSVADARDFELLPLTQRDPAASASAAVSNFT